MRKDSRVVVGIGASVSARVTLGIGEAIRVRSSTVWMASSGVKLMVKEGWGVSVESAKGAAAGALEKNGRQAASKAAIINKNGSEIRFGMKQVILKTRQFMRKMGLLVMSAVQTALSQVHGLASIF